MIGRLASFVRNLLRGNAVERALDDELRSSVELLTEEKVEKGAPPSEARRLALIALGGVEQVREEARAARAGAGLEAVGREVRLAIRNLTRAPVFSCAVVLTLGLALGANAAVFTLLNRLVLRPLPVRDPGALTIVNARPIPTRGSRFIVSGRSEAGVAHLSYPLFRTLRDSVLAFDGVIAETGLDTTMVAAGEPIAVKTSLVSGNYLQVLGVSVVLGRAFTEADEGGSGSSPLLVLTDGFWRRQFGSDPSVVGRTVRLNQVPLTVIGVAAPGFAGTVAGEAPDVVVPANMRDSLVRSSPRFPLRYDSPDLHLYKVMARLAPGVTQQQAERAADGLYRSLVQESLGNDGYWTRTTQERLTTQHLTLIPGGQASNDQSALGRGLQTPVVLLMGMVTLVLFVAAGNVTNLVLARGEARTSETVIRLALGAGRWRVVRQSLWESLLLSLAACGFGLLLARWTSGFASALLNVERLPDGVTSAPDWQTSAAALVLALITGIGVWAASTLQSSRHWGSDAGALNIQTVRQPRPSLGRRLLVVAQVSLSLVLLCASMVLSRSLARLMAVDPGFTVDGLYGLTVSPGQAGLADATQRAYLDGLSQEIRSIPGVMAVAVTNGLPIASEHRKAFVTSDRSTRNDVATRVIDAGPEYFAALGLPLSAGRGFTHEEAASGAKVAVVNESMARQLFPGGGALDGHVGLDQEPDLRVLGIVRDTKTGPRAVVQPTVFRPLTSGGLGGAVSLVIRVSAPSALSAGTVRAAARRAGGSVVINDFSSMRERLSRLLYRDRILAFLSSGLAALAAVLSAIGVFGLATYSVHRRTQEFGLRIALGATHGSIQWLVFKQVGWLAVAGCVTGLLGFAAAGRVLASVLFELTPGDPASVAGAVALLAVTVSLAAFLPALRAARLDPVASLRRE